MTGKHPTVTDDGGRGPSLRGRLLRTLAIAAVSLVAVSALATFALARLGGAIGLILRENYVSVVACQEMNDALERQDSAALFWAVDHEEIARPMMTAERVAFDVGFTKEAANVTLPTEGQLVGELEVAYKDYVSAVDRVLASPPDKRVDGYFRELLPRFRAVAQKVTAIRLLNQAAMEQADTAARATAARTRNIAAIVTLSALALVAWLARSVPRTVLTPLVGFSERARAIGEGNLDVPLSMPEIRELSILAHAMNRMQDKLRAYRDSSLGELLAAKDLSRATIAALADPVIVFSARGEVLLTNEAAETIFGLSAGGADELRRAGVELPAPIAAARDAVLSNGDIIVPRSLSEAMRWMANEGERYFLVRASPLKSEDAAGAAVIVVAQDVTRYRRIDALKSDVVATVSHELKTPLTSLRLATHMLLDEQDKRAHTPVERELAEMARDETERLQSTVDELLDLVRIEREAGALSLALVAPAVLLREVAAAHATPARQRNVRLEVIADDATTVEVDDEQMAILLGDLVSNAIRHSRDGGVVRLTAKSEGTDVVFTVEDEGEGIPPEHLPRIFERHFSGSEPAKLKGRHGLGLAIAREIALRHGGTLDVASEVGKGSVFTLRVPQSGG